MYRHSYEETLASNQRQWDRDNAKGANKMAKALEQMKEVGLDAYIDHGRLYFRTTTGGVIAITSQIELRLWIDSAARKRAKGMNPNEVS